MRLDTYACQRALIGLVLLLPSSSAAGSGPESVVDRLLTSRSNRNFFEERYREIVDYRIN